MSDPRAFETEVNMTISERQSRIILAAGASPSWLFNRTDSGWLDLCYKLVTAGVVVLTDSGPEVCKSSTGEQLMRHAHEIAALLST